MEKKCSKCVVNKPLSEFNKRSNSKDGYRFECKDCQKLHYEANRDHYIAKMKENRDNKLDEYVNRDKAYYEANKTEILKKKKQYHVDNQEMLLKKAKEYYIKHKDERSIYNKKWVKDNIIHYRKYQKEYSKQYREKYPHIILWRSMLRCSLIRLGKIKEEYTIDLLGYSSLDFKQHIESLFTDGMNWDNYGEWHIDHIKDVVLFDEDTPPYVVNALTNLRPLWATTRKINGVVYEGNLNRKKSFRLKK
jgi:hypothetical protein